MPRPSSLTVWLYQEHAGSGLLRYEVGRVLPVWTRRPLPEPTYLEGKLIARLAMAAGR